MRNCSGLSNFETEVLIATVMVVDLVVFLVVVVVGLGIVGWVYPRDCLTRPIYLRLASIRHCL